MATSTDVPRVHLHIGEKMLAEGSAGAHEHVWPIDGRSLSRVPLAGADQVDAAVRAADAAFADWSSWKPARRVLVLRRLADVIRADRAELSRLCVMDNGMSLRMGEVAVDTLAGYTDYYAGWADKIEGRVTSTPGRSRELAYTTPEPYGVVAVIMTWNSPMFSVGMKLIPALAAGNTVVLKPSELTPYSSERLMTLVREAGIPAGVVNLLIGGPSTGDALVRHPLVEKVSFTGGPVTARKIMVACAESLKPAVLELGGKSANLVFPDADLEAVSAVNAFSACGTLAGQGCAIPSRMLVHDSVYDEIVARVVAVVNRMPAGDPFAPGTVLGPLINHAAQERVLGMIERARSSGAGTLLTGGGIPDGASPDGYYVEPTVFGDVDPDSELGQVEVFGPVMSLMRFSSEEQAVRIANGTQYGLASYLWTKDAGRINRLVPQLRAGGVYVNGAPPVVGCELPFGGLGISGYGREGGLEGLLEFVRTKAVAIA